MQQEIKEKLELEQLLIIGENNKVKDVITQQVL
jgi:hypothetical protein